MIYKELSKKSSEDLKKELTEVREKLQTIRIKNKLSQVKKTHEIPALRKDVARILTALNIRIEFND